MTDWEARANASVAQTRSAADKLNDATAALLKDVRDGKNTDTSAEAFRQANDAYGGLTAGHSKKPSL